LTDSLTWVPDARRAENQGRRPIAGWADLGVDLGSRLEVDLNVPSRLNKVTPRSEGGVLGRVVGEAIVHTSFGVWGSAVSSSSGVQGGNLLLL